MSRAGNKRVSLTQRDLRLLQKLNAAGWLTSRQIRDYFFPDKSPNAVCKRLRKLACAKYIASARTSSTEAAFYRLAGQGRLALIEQTLCNEADITIPMQLPRKLRHFVGINQIRLHFERGLEPGDGRLLFFFSERELGRYHSGHELADPILSLIKTSGLIPDAIARVSLPNTAHPLNALIEYDEGTEHAVFFGRTKVRQYTALFNQNQSRLGNVKVLTFASSIKRLVSLMRQVAHRQAPPRLFYFALLHKLEVARWIEAELFLDPHDFFAQVVQGSRAGVVEREHQGIPKHALVDLQ